MNQSKLNHILDRHDAWLKGDTSFGEVANLRGADLQLASLGGLDLRRVDLHGADLRHTDLRYTFLSYACLNGASIVGADFSNAHLDNANLSGAVLHGTSLASADLSGANLRGADLRGANLRGADLRDADLLGADLLGAHLANCILWATKGDGVFIKNMHIDEMYMIAYTSTYLQIGCQKHLIKNWFEFDDDTIHAMDEVDALKWWSEHKDTIYNTIKNNPAKPTK